MHLECEGLNVLRMYVVYEGEEAEDDDDDDDDHPPVGSRMMGKYGMRMAIQQMLENDRWVGVQNEGWSRRLEVGSSCSPTIHVGLTFVRLLSDLGPQFPSRERRSMHVQLEP